MTALSFASRAALALSLPQDITWSRTTLRSAPTTTLAHMSEHSLTDAQNHGCSSQAQSLHDSIRSVEGTSHHIEKPAQCTIVYRVPADVLSSIFLSLDPPDVSDPSARWGTWLSFSQVCSAWRQIALDEPRLWVCPPLRFPSLAKEMIKRARGCPLDLRYYLANRGWKSRDLADVLDPAFEKGKNIRILKISLISKDQLESYLPRLSCTYLEKLYLDLDGDPRGRLNLPLISTPRLRYLKIVDCILPLQMESLHHLAHLSIISLNRYPSMLLSPHSLLDFLQGAPNLTYLEVINVLSATQVADSAQGPPTIYLPRIKFFRITSEPTLMLELLRSIKLPVAELNEPSFASADKPSFYKLAVEHRPWSTTVEDFYTLSAARFGCKSQDKPDGVDLEDGLQVEFCHMRDIEEASFLLQLRGCIPLESISTVEASCVENFTTIALFPNLREITLRGTARGFIRLLCESSGSSSQRMYFTQLSSIRFFGVDDLYEGDYSLHEFLDALIRHKWLGMPLESLSFAYGIIQEEDKFEIRNILQNQDICVLIETHHPVPENDVDDLLYGP